MGTGRGRLHLWPTYTYKPARRKGSRESGQLQLMERDASKVLSKSTELGEYRISRGLLRADRAVVGCSEGGGFSTPLRSWYNGIGCRKKRAWRDRKSTLQAQPVELPLGNSRF